MSMKHRTEAFYETDKGEMVQNLLCRWWYAMEWPKESDLQPVRFYLKWKQYVCVFRKRELIVFYCSRGCAQAPEGYEMLDGYKGVYICTRVSRGH